MKNIRKSIIALTVLFFASVSAYSCEFDFEIISGKKDVYSINDEVTAKVTLTQNHRNCSEGLGNVKFDPNGMEIKQATKWVEKSSGVFERKLKLKITSSDKATLNAVRTCSKDGGKGTLTLKVK